MHTVDGRNPKQPPNMYETLQIMGQNYHINWWSPDFWTINSTSSTRTSRGRKFPVYKKNINL